ncbi:sensor domain-containing diguanylate cyclase [bacterium]|nr:sensor domain-containing diguanylate cyclase [bacterium]
MENKELHFLTKISDILVKEVDTAELALELKTVLETYVKINNLKVFVFDNVTSTMRDCADSWKVIEDNSEIYSAFENIKEHDFVINSKAYKLPPSIGEVTLKVSSLVMPMLKEGNVFGLIELEFDDDTSIDMEFLFLMRIFAAQASLKLQNIILNEQSKINVEFHDSMKNIAKIIETQYELNYIVPLIGEMLDRFISDHLIYVFLKQDNEFKLVWPKACKDERIYETLKQLTPETNYILTSDDKIGAFPLTSDGEITGCIVARSTLDKLSKRDISYLEQLTRQSAITINRANTYSKVLQYATLDALTNLNNRRQFEVRLKQEIATTKRQKNPLCAMMVDIDFFKKVNDTYGHASGDAVLRTVASIIKEHLRESDIPSRYGGEEFAVLLPYTHIEEAKIVGERLRKAVETTPIPIDKKNINVTISMGLAEFSPQETGEDLFKRADSALYEAKESGRNRVCVDLSVNH